MNKLKFTAVDKSNWKDLEKLFESRGGPHSCWCMVWRNMDEGKDRTKKNDKKESLKSYIGKGVPVGLLCYDNFEPIAWCSIAPRNSYRELGGIKELNNVWSLVCFFVKREYRNNGLIKELIKQAEKYAKSNGAEYIEAYPVEKESPSYRFMGFKSSFEDVDYEFKQKAGKRRNVMVKKIK